MIKVLVVDDSLFFRNRLIEIIRFDPLMEVIGSASNGQEAIEKAIRLKPDVITMDIDMPIMDGITAVKHIMKVQPVPILMFSAQTHLGAKSTLLALDAGAVDFMTKKISGMTGDFNTVAQEIRLKIKEIAACKSFSVRESELDLKHNSKKLSLKKNYDIVLIGTSTGGPVALQKILETLPKNFSVPIVVIQHMPESFTSTFAERLDSLCYLHVIEASHNWCPKPGEAILAPGGKQLSFLKTEKLPLIKIQNGDALARYKPSIDLSFSSAAECFNGKVLAIILTGMGSDGREGARALKAQGAKIWAQDEASCVVFGMPSSVISAGLADEILGLDMISSKMIKELE